VWRALLDTDRISEVRWNLPLAVSLRGHKRASTRCRLGGSPAAVDRGDWLSPYGSEASERAITMQITNFKDMYIAELQELVSMEGQLADELPRMAEVVSSWWR
jgi:hypothetical protein